jgi:Family of unknown function (DUF695)
MWPFSKKMAESPRLTAPDDWSLAQGERDGFPMIVRMANAYRGLAPLPGYDHHVIISIQLRNPRPNGFPSSEEGDDLQALEENLCRVLETGNDTLCVLVVTNNGLRDLIFYTRNVESVQQRTEEAKSVYSGFEIEFWIEPDEGWDVYRHFSKWIKPSQGVEKTPSA